MGDGLKNVPKFDMTLTAIGYQTEMRQSKLFTLREVGGWGEHSAITLFFIGVPPMSFPTRSSPLSQWIFFFHKLFALLSLLKSLRN